MALHHHVLQKPMSSCLVFLARILHSILIARAHGAVLNAGCRLWTSNMYTENNLCEIVRSVAGDLVEETKLIDDFTHPKTVRPDLHCRACLMDTLLLPSFCIALQALPTN